VNESVPLIRLQGVSKTFGGVQALQDANLTIPQGEVVGLLGENGSGKSTLIKILSGYHAPDAGELAVQGEVVKLPLYPGQFRSLGFEFVHQDLGLVRSLSVLENLLLTEIASSRQRPYISWRAERRRARELFARYGVDLDPAAKVGELAPIAQAALAIVRAVEGVRRHRAESGRSGEGLLVLDEPTVFLPRAGRESLFALIREVAASGSSVLFVSHYLDEVREVTDRVTVLRDGRVVGSAVTTSLSEADLVEMIVGRKLASLEPAGRASGGRPHLARVENVVGDFADAVSFVLHEGEVLGLTGLAGSGFEEVPYLLFGAQRAKQGAITLDGQHYDLSAMTPAKAVAAGIALVPGDRQRDASIATLPITENIAVPAMLPRFFRRLLLRRRGLEIAVAELMRRFDVRPPDPKPVYSSLSGGNQQKAVLAKWFETQPRILLLHEPTQGVDVGARGQIFGLLREAAENGIGVICASSDYEQLEAVCDRVIVLSRGRIYRELVGSEVRKQRIAEQCYDSMRMPNEGAPDIETISAQRGVMG
jgi:ribose transport system ATP-binding protein